MFCFQCQEAAKGTGRTVKGVCGKTDDVANLQDTLLFVLKGISWYNEKLRAEKLNPAEVDKVVFDGMFSTITNANFDKESFVKRISASLELRDKLHQKCMQAGIDLPEELPDFAVWSGSTAGEFEQKSSEVGVLSTSSEDIRSLRQLVIYGVKGMAAYAEHAWNLGHKKEEFETFNGPILFTTNCIVPPRKNAGYRDRIYTTGASGLEGAIHIPDRKNEEMKDFSAIIKHAKKCDPPRQIESGEITGGFAHAQVFALTDKIVDAVKSGTITEPDADIKMFLDEKVA